MYLGIESWCLLSIYDRKKLVIMGEPICFFSCRPSALLFYPAEAVANVCLYVVLAAGSRGAVNLSTD